MKEYEDNSSIDEKKLEQRQRKDNTFNIIIGISTLLIALFGATFAYFSATASSRENDVNVQSAYVSISYIGGTEIHATNLIPSTERIAIKMYQKEMEIFGTVKDEGLALEEDTDEVSNNDPSKRCIDAKGREVCAVYEFKIKSEGEEDGTTSIAGGIKVETNQFDNLSYIVYEVEYDKKMPEEYEYIDKFGHKIVKTYHVISEFNGVDNTNDDHITADPNYNVFEKPTDKRSSDGNYEATVKPIACLFGFSSTYKTADQLENDELDQLADPNRCKKLSITNQEEHYYQVLIWLREIGQVQHEQGKKFEGTVTLEVPSGSGYEDGKITGQDG